MALNDSAAALAQFQVAAKAGYPEAMTSVARAIRDGDAIARDVPAAIELMKKAAEAGSSNAMASLGVFYSRDAQRNDDVALLWFRRAADLNNSLGTNNLASMYRDGRGVPRNTSTAATLYEKAIGLEYPPAMFNLALLLDTGKGVKRDAPREAALLLRGLTLDRDLYDNLIGSRAQLSEELIRAIQALLQQRGEYIGPLDGIFGEDTRKALSKEVGR
jgi:TPR repeat protein